MTRFAHGASEADKSRVKPLRGNDNIHAAPGSSPMNGQLMLRPGHGLILCSATLLILGVIMVNSAGQTVGGDAAFSSDSAATLPAILTSRTAIYAVAAGIVMVLASLLPIGFLRQRTGWQAPTTWLALIIICLLLAVHVPGLSRTMNGSSRWLRLGSMSFQPSELTMVPKAAR